MSNDQHLAELLDLFVEDILLGVATVEECLAEAPEYRAELEPLLRAAMDVTAIPVPEVQPDPARRAAFMAELRATPQQRPRFTLPSLPSFGLGMPMLRVASVGVPAALVAVIALVLVWSGSPSTASAATLTVFAGQVEVQAKDGGWELLDDGASLEEGIMIRTGEGSFAMLTFPDGSTATVDASTQLGLDQIAVNGARQIGLRQESGRIWNDVVPIGVGDSYVIRTPHAVVAAHGTVFETTVNGDTSVETAEGHVSLALGERTVDVAAGQIVRATADGIGEPQRSHVAGEIQISGPVVAYLQSPKGAATGVLLNGLAFRQIPGIITTDVEMVDGRAQQRIVVGAASLGEYSLVLRRYAPGEGSVTVTTPASSLTIRVAESVEIARLPLELAVATDGAAAIRTLSSELESVGEAPQVRVVETERSRSAESIDASVSTGTATAQVTTRTATPEATATPDATRDSSTAAATATPWRPSATPTPTPTPDDWAARLQEALSGDSDRRLESVLDDLLDSDDGTKATRLAILAAAMSDPRAAERIRSAVGRDDAEAISNDAERLVPALADALRSTLTDDRENDRRDGGRGDRNREEIGSDPPARQDDELADDSSDREGGRSRVPEWIQDWLDAIQDRRSAERDQTTATPTPTDGTPVSATAVPAAEPTVVPATPTPERPSWWDRFSPVR